MENFFANPFFYIGALFAFFAALGFLIYLRGFIGGIGHVFTKTGHDDHVKHANLRATWGLLILSYVFIVWQIIRLIAGWLMRWW